MRLLTRDEERKFALLSLESANSTGFEFPISRVRGVSSMEIRGLTINVKIRPRKYWDIEHLRNTSASADRMEGIYQVRDADSLLQDSLSSGLQLIVFGRAANPVNENARVRKELEATIRRLVTVPYGEPESGKISPDVALAAHEFIALLPDELPLPKVGPDHEGGLLLAWEKTSPDLIVTLEAHRLHFVVNPGTANAEYFDDIVFTWDRLPSELVPHLPKTRA